MVISCGLLMYVRADTGPKVLLVHPGGPFWRGKDQGAWSIPKGIAEAGEDRLTAAQREFTEETGLTPRPPFLPLAPLKQKGGKVVHCWAFEGRDEPLAPGSSSFELEWPPRSGKRKHFPEVDDVRLFTIADAQEKMLTGQRPFLAELSGLL